MVFIKTHKYFVFIFKLPFCNAGFLCNRRYGFTVVGEILSIFLLCDFEDSLLDQIKMTENRLEFDRKKIDNDE